MSGALKLLWAYRVRWRDIESIQSCRRAMRVVPNFRLFRDQLGAGDAEAAPEAIIRGQPTTRTAMEPRVPQAWQETGLGIAITKHHPLPADSEC